MLTADKHEEGCATELRVPQSKCRSMNGSFRGKTNFILKGAAIMLEEKTYSNDGIRL